MTTIDRYRVRENAGQKWTDPGPDLLRQKDNAWSVVSKTVGFSGNKNLVTRRQKINGDWTPWSDEGRKFSVRLAFGDWNPIRESIFQVGRQKLSDIQVLVVVQHEKVALTTEGGIGGAAATFNSLTRHQFPGSQFSGGFVCKETSPGWTSDHAWKEAFDRTENKATGDDNDDIFSWQVRMVKNGCATADYILGSKSGKVVQAVTPGWDIESSSASDSHLWHTHVSVVDHDGANSPFC